MREVERKRGRECEECLESSSGVVQGRVCRGGKRKGVARDASREPRIRWCLWFLRFPCPFCSFSSFLYRLSFLLSTPSSPLTLPPFLYRILSRNLSPSPIGRKQRRSNVCRSTELALVLHSDVPAKLEIVHEIRDMCKTVRAFAVNSVSFYLRFHIRLFVVSKIIRQN